MLRAQRRCEGGAEEVQTCVRPGEAVGARVVDDEGDRHVFFPRAPLDAVRTVILPAAILALAPLAIARLVVVFGLPCRVAHALVAGVISAEALGAFVKSVWVVSVTVTVAATATVIVSSAHNPDFQSPAMLLCGSSLTIGSQPLLPERSSLLFNSLLLQFLTL